MNTLLNAALLYAEKGFAVFPCIPNEKRPLTQRGFHDATTQVETIKAWWSEHPTANLAMPTGRMTGLSVIDLDGPEGIRFAEEHAFPLTLTVQTPRMGQHLYYDYDARLHTGAGFAPQVDVRNDGGYVLVPPSEVNGKPYTFLHQRDIATLGIIPDDLKRHSRNMPPRPEAPHPNMPHWVSAALNGVPESQRNDTAARLIGYFHAKGLTTDVIASIMLSWAERCNPPMNRQELASTIASVTRYPTSFMGIKALGNEYLLIP